MRVSLFSSLTSAACARNPLGSVVNPGLMDMIDPTIPMDGARRIREVYFARAVLAKATMPAAQRQRRICTSSMKPCMPVWMLPALPSSVSMCIASR